MAERIKYSLGIDVGGTFTDFVLADIDTSEIRTLKEPSTPSDMSIGVLRGIARFGVDAGKIGYIIHGTTAGLNAIIQKSGDKTGLIATRGFSDILEIGDMAKLDMYDLFYRKAMPLVAREHCFSVDERVSSSGEILKPIEEEQVRKLAQEMKRQNIKSVAICTLNSYANPENEERIAAIVGDECPEMDVSVSSRIVRQRNEIYRASTAATNAYIAPILRRYLSSLKSKLRNVGFNGSLYIMGSNGGVMSVEKTEKMPVYTLLSGPVGGSIGGLALCEKLRLRNMITFDMGGTSCDISVIHDGAPEVNLQPMVSGYRVLTPAVNISYLGAGGGSIARIVGDTALRVGPESAGAVPGPACYGMGGKLPTVTDADLVLGRLSQASELAGGIALREDLARQAIKEHVADRLGLSVEDAALGILRIAGDRMGHAIREVTVQQGLDPREFALVPFGGAGPMHAAEIAQAIGIRRLIVPASPGNFCAWGMLNTDLRHDLVQTLKKPVQLSELATVSGALGELGEEGRLAIQAERVAPEDVSVQHMVDMRYRGQDHTLTVDIPSLPLSDGIMAQVKLQFDAEHLRKFGHNSPKQPAEIVNARVEITGRMKHVGVAPLQSPTKEGVPDFRKVTFEGGTFETATYNRSELAPGVQIAGPAIINEDGATTVLPPNFHAAIDEFGSIRVDVPADVHALPSTSKQRRNQHKLDPVTVEVVRNALISIAEEMSVNIQRSAHNWIITKGKDHSTGIYGPASETYAQAQGLPEFVCDMPTAIRSILDDLGGLQNFRDGEVYLTNDPYATTLHVNDVNAVKPVFYKGEIVAFCGARVHWHDIGGAVRAGNMTATEIFQEGLILRTVRIVDAKGEFDRNIMSVIRENNRIPEHTIGDLKAQIGACMIGSARLVSLIDKYGLATYRQCVTTIMDNGEAVAKRALARIPEGEYEAGSCLDNDGVDLDRPLPIHAKLIVKDQTMTFDLTGSAEGCRGPMHCSASITGSICRMIFKMLTTPQEPANEGHFRMVNLVIPEKSIFRAKKPEATLPGFFALEALLDCAKRALAPAVPELVNADDYGKCTPAHIAFLTPEGEYLFLPDTEGGGWGAKPFEDGENALRFNPGPIVSTEDHESKFPVRLSQYTLRSDSGGPGKFRGGLGIIKDYEALVDCSFNAGLDRQVCPPQGILGGLAAMGQRLVIKKPDGTEIRLPSKVSSYPVNRGEIISFQTAGGGGYGNPLDRDLHSIASDLRKGLVSIAAAERYYGVVVDRGTLEASRDQVATRLATIPG